MAEPAKTERQTTSSAKPSPGAEKSPPEEGGEAEATEGKSSGGKVKRTLLIRLGVVLFLAAIVLGECVFAYRLLSTASAQGTSPAQGASSAQGSSETASPSAGTAKEPASGETAGGESESGKGRRFAKGASIDPLDEGDAASAESPVEVDLGQFTVTTHQPAASMTMRIDFHLNGIVAAKDKDEFEKLKKAIEFRFREQVLVTVRSAEPPDLADAGLGLIKRQILEKTNALLGRRILRALIVSDFSYMEQ